VMKMRRTFLAVRSLSTKRPGRSTRGDAAYESHMQAATVRHRRNRARIKEKKLPEVKAQTKRISGRRERAVKSAIPSRTVNSQSHRSKRLDTSGTLAKSNRSAIESQRAKRSLKSPREPLPQTSPEAISSKSTSIVDAADAKGSPTSSRGSLLMLLGIVSGGMIWISGQYPEIQEEFPLFKNFIKEAKQLVLSGAKVELKEMKSEQTSEHPKRQGWFASLWHRS